MIAEIGHYALVLALALALIQATIPILGAWRGDATLMRVGPTVSIAQFLFVGIAFAALTHAYVVSDFSLLNVVENSHSLKPMLFKVTGVWGNHEGSMLLWVLILALFGASVAAFGKNLPSVLKSNVIGVQGWISVTFLLFILLTSNPFLRVDPAPYQGNDLNPVLQDIGLAIHPPLLYLGYVGYSISFAFAIGALIEGRLDAAWAIWVRPWALAAWCFLTAGIAMGSYWAYYELGWGGWWFWDPVENASFMPWLAGTALLHSAVVMEKRDALKIWTVLLAILTFSLSLLGTFLVRSGVLTSVHAFATDPLRGSFILAILCLFIGGGLALFALRVRSLTPGGIFAPVSREGALVLNNIILTASCLTVLIGTLYPLLLEATVGSKISVGAPFFNMTFGPLMIPLLIALPFGPFLAWKRGDLLGAMQRLYAALAAAFVVGLVAYWVTEGGPILAIIGIGLSAWLIVGALSDIIERGRFRDVGLSVGLARIMGLPRSAFGTMFAHAGMGITLLGIVSVTAFQSENITTMKPGDTANIGAYQVTFDGVEDRAVNNYREQVVHMTARKDGVVAFTLEPTKRYFSTRQMQTSEAAIRTHFFSQLYVTLGDASDDGKSLVVRMWDKPLVTFIWIGALVMMAGGALSISDRRLRVGAPRPARNAQPKAA